MAGVFHVVCVRSVSPLLVHCQCLTRAMLVVRGLYAHVCVAPRSYAMPAQLHNRHVKLRALTAWRSATTEAVALRAAVGFHRRLIARRAIRALQLTVHLAKSRRRAVEWHEQVLQAKAFAAFAVQAARRRFCRDAVMHFRGIVARRIGRECLAAWHGVAVAQRLGRRACLRRGWRTFRAGLGWWRVRAAMEKKALAYVVAAFAPVWMEVVSSRFLTWSAGCVLGRAQLLRPTRAAGCKQRAHPWPPQQRVTVHAVGWSRLARGPHAGVTGGYHAGAGDCSARSQGRLLWHQAGLGTKEEEGEEEADARGQRVFLRAPWRQGKASRGFHCANRQPRGWTGRWRGVRAAVTG